jgi:hypothetical protein
VLQLGDEVDELTVRGLGAVHLAHLALHSLEPRRLLRRRLVQLAPQLHRRALYCRRQLPLQVAQLALQPARARRAILTRRMRHRRVRVKRSLQPRGRFECTRRALGHLVRLGLGLGLGLGQGLGLGLGLGLG